MSENNNSGGGIPSFFDMDISGTYTGSMFHDTSPQASKEESLKRATNAKRAKFTSDELAQNLNTFRANNPNASAEMETAFIDARIRDAGIRRDAMDVVQDGAVGALDSMNKIVVDTTAAAVDAVTSPLDTGTAWDKGISDTVDDLIRYGASLTGNASKAEGIIDSIDSAMEYHPAKQLSAEGRRLFGSMDLENPISKAGEDAANLLRRGSAWASEGMQEYKSDMGKQRDQARAEQQAEYERRLRAELPENPTDEQIQEVELKIASEQVRNSRLEDTAVKAAESAPYMIPAARAAKLGGTLSKAAAAKKGKEAILAGTKTTKQVAKDVAKAEKQGRVLGSTAAVGALEGSSTGADTYNAVVDTPIETLRENNEEFLELEKKYGAEEAREKLATKLSREKGGGVGVISSAANALTGGYAENILAGAKSSVSKAVAKSADTAASTGKKALLKMAAKKVTAPLKAAATEGVEEYIQSGVGAQSANRVSDETTGSDKGTTGVTAQATEGAMAGSLSAGVMTAPAPMVETATDAIKGTFSAVKGTAQAKAQAKSAKAEEVTTDNLKATEATRIVSQLKEVEDTDIETESDASLSNISAHLDDVLKSGKVSTEDKDVLSVMKSKVDAQLDARQTTEDEETLATSQDDIAAAEKHEPSELESKLVNKGYADMVGEDLGSNTKELNKTLTRIKTADKENTNRVINSVSNRMDAMVEEGKKDSKGYKAFSKIRDAALARQEQLKRSEREIPAAVNADAQVKAAALKKDKGHITNAALHEPELSVEERTKSAEFTADRLGLAGSESSRGSRAKVVDAGKAVAQAASASKSATEQAKNASDNPSKLEAVHTEVVGDIARQTVLGGDAVLNGDMPTVQEAVISLNQRIEGADRGIKGKNPKTGKGHTPSYKAALAAEKEYAQKSLDYLKAQADAKGIKGVDYTKLTRDFTVKGTPSGSLEGNALADGKADGITLTPKGRNSVFQGMAQWLKGSSKTDLAKPTEAAIAKANLTDREKEVLKAVRDSSTHSLKAGNSTAAERESIVNKLDAAIAESADIPSANIHAFLREQAPDLFHKVYGKGTTKNEYEVVELSQEYADKKTRKSHANIAESEYVNLEGTGLREYEASLVQLLGDGYAVTDSLDTDAVVMDNVKQMVEVVNTDKVENVSKNSNPAPVNPYPKAETKTAKVMKLVPSSIKGMFLTAKKGTRTIFRLKSPLADLTSDNQAIIDNLYLNIPEAQRETIQAFLNTLKEPLAKLSKVDTEFVDWANRTKGASDAKGPIGFQKIYASITSKVEGKHPSDIINRMKFIVDSKGAVSLNPEYAAFAEGGFLSGLSWINTSSTAGDSAALKGALQTILPKALGGLDSESLKMLSVVNDKGKPVQGNSQQYVVESLGKAILSASGISVASSDDVANTVNAALVQELGQHALVQLEVAGAITRAGYDAKYAKGKVTLTPAKGKPNIVVIRKTDTYANKVRGLSTKSEGATSSLNKLLENLTGAARQGGELYTEQQETKNKSNHNLAKEQAEAVKAMGAQESTPDEGMAKALLSSWESTDPEVQKTFYAAFGVEVNNDDVLPIMRESNEARKNEIDDIMVRLKDIQSNPEEYGSLFQRVGIATNHRMNISSGVTWQGSKNLVRGLTGASADTFDISGNTSASKVVVRGSNKKVSQRDALKIAIARMFDVDKAGYYGHLDFVHDMFGFTKDGVPYKQAGKLTPEQVKARKISELAVKYSAGETLAPSELNTLMSGIQNKSHATTELMAYTAMGKWLQAHSEGKDSIELKTYREDDGIANGAALLLAANGLATDSVQDLIKVSTSLGYNIAGMANLQDLRNAKDKDGTLEVEDFYQQIGAPIFESILGTTKGDGFNPSVDSEGNTNSVEKAEFVAAVTTLLGTSNPNALRKLLRNAVKGPLMRDIYGAGEKARLDSVNVLFAEKLISRVAEIQEKYKASKSDGAVDAKQVRDERVAQINKALSILERLQVDADTGNFALKPVPKYFKPVTLSAMPNEDIVFKKAGKELSSTLELMAATGNGWSMLIGNKVTGAVRRRIASGRAMLDSYSTTLNHIGATYVAAYNGMVKNAIADSTDGVVTQAMEDRIRTELNDIFIGVPTVITDALGTATIKAWNSNLVASKGQTVTTNLLKQGKDGKGTGTSITSGLVNTQSTAHTVGNPHAVHSTDASLVIKAVLADKQLRQVYDGFIQSALSNVGTDAANKGVEGLYGKDAFNSLEAATKTLDDLYVTLAKKFNNGKVPEVNTGLAGLMDTMFGKGSARDSKLVTRTKVHDDEGNVRSFNVTPEMSLALQKEYMIPAVKAWQEFYGKFITSANQYGDVFQGLNGIKDAPNKAETFFAIVNGKRELPQELQDLETEYQKVNAALKKAAESSHPSVVGGELSAWNELLKKHNYAEMSEDVFGAHDVIPQVAAAPTGKSLFDEVLKEVGGYPNVGQVTPTTKADVEAGIDHFIATGVEYFLNQEGVDADVRISNANRFRDYMFSKVSGTRKGKGNGTTVGNFKNIIAEMARVLMQDNVSQLEVAETELTNVTEKDVAVAEDMAEQTTGSNEEVTPSAQQEPVNEPVTTPPANEGTRGSRAQDQTGEYGENVPHETQFIETYRDARKETITTIFDEFATTSGTNNNDTHTEHLREVTEAAAESFDAVGEKVIINLHNDITEDMEAWGEVTPQGLLSNVIDIYTPEGPLGSSMAATPEEVLAHEMSHPIWKYALKVPALLKRAEALFDTISGGDYTLMLDPEIEFPTQRDIDLAKRRYKYITTSKYALEEFLSHALTNKMFRKNLQTLLAKNPAKAEGFWDKLKELYRSAVDRILGQSSNYGKMRGNAKEEIDALFLETLSVKNKAATKLGRDRISAAIDKGTTQVNKGVGKAINTVAPKMMTTALAFTESRNQTPDTLGLARSIADAVRQGANDRNATLNTHVIKMVSNVFGKKSNMNEVGRIIEQGTTDVDAVARQMHEATYSSIRELFESEPTKQQQRDMGEVIGRTDLGFLLEQGYEMDAILDMLNDNVALSKAKKRVINDLRRAMGTKEVSAKEKALLGHAAVAGQFMIEPSTAAGVGLQNASMIVKQVENYFGKGVDAYSLNPDVVNAVDTMMTLEAITATDMAARERIAEMGRNEETRSAMQAVVAAQNVYRSTSANSAFKNQEHLMIKGHMADLTNQDKDIVFDSVHSEKALKRKGYKLVKTENYPAGVASNKPMSMGVYVRNFGAVSAKSNSALYGVTNQRAGETIGDIFAATQQGKSADEIHANAKEVTRKNQAILDNETKRLAAGLPLTKGATFGMTPVPSAGKQSSTWRMNTVDRAFKEEHLDLGYDYIESLSKGMAHVSYKANVPTQNKKAVDLMVQQAEGYRADPSAFVDLAFDHDDIVNQINQLDVDSLEYLKEAFPSGKVRVRKSSVQDFFGYRKWAPLDMQHMELPPKGDRNPINVIYAGINNILVPLLNNHIAARYHYLHTNVVKEIAKTIVIRGMRVIKNNIISNVFIAAGAGMYPTATNLRNVVKGWRLAGDYTNKRSELAMLNAQLRLEEGKGKGASKVKVAKLTRTIAAKQNALEAHEVHPMAEAGYLSTVSSELDTHQTMNTAAKGGIRRHTEPLLNKTGILGKAIKESYGTEDSNSFRALQDTMVHSEFGFKYAMMMQQQGKGKSQKEGMELVDRIFFNYGIPSSKFIDALEGLGFVMFPKFALQALNATAYTAAENPSRFLLEQSVRNIFFPSVGGLTDSALLGGSITNLMYNPYDQASAVLRPAILEASFGGAARMVGQ